MNPPASRHQVHLERNREVWRNKPLLRQVYAAFYQRISRLIDLQIPGRIVEVGSGIGNLKAHLPQSLSTDLFPNPWLDLVCDAYELPFQEASLSHLILFDVFHHLQAPRAFLREARRVLVSAGRLILFEPYISWSSLWAYGIFHEEPLGWGRRIDSSDSLPRPRAYYAAQANATRLFFSHKPAGWPPDWAVGYRAVLAGFSYLLSGGFSKPAFYPQRWLGRLQRWDERLSRWPRLFGARCLVALSPR